MRPDRPGIWEWFDENGTKLLMEVFDVADELRKVYPDEKPYLRVYWWGGYYNVHPDNDPETLEQDPNYNDDMWPDRWGNRVGDNNSLSEEQLYLGPTPEKRNEIFKNI